MKLVEKIISMRENSIQKHYKQTKKKLRELNKEYKKLSNEYVILSKLNKELKDVNYEISYNNIDLIEQRKKYQKRIKQLRQENIELKNLLGKEQTWKLKK